MSFNRLYSLHAGALLLLLAPIAACGSSSDGSTATPATSAPTHASTPPDPTVAPASSDPNAGLMTGTKLKTLLLPGSALPKGFKKSEDGAVNTGDSFGSPSSAPAAPGAACRTLLGTAWIDAAGIGSASFAQDDYADSYSNQFGQEIDTFRGSDAATVMSRLRQVFTQCAIFKDKSDQGTAVIKLTTSPASGLGDEAVKALMTSNSWEGGQTLVAARVGNTVVTAFYSSTGPDKGRAAVALTAQLVNNVKAANRGADSS